MSTALHQQGRLKGLSHSDLLHLPEREGDQEYIWASPKGDAQA